jgi:hypothetical protein
VRDRESVCARQCSGPMDRPTNLAGSVLRRCRPPERLGTTASCPAGSRRAATRAAFPVASRRDGVRGSDRLLPRDATCFDPGSSGGRCTHRRRRRTSRADRPRETGNGPALRTPAARLSLQRDPLADAFQLPMNSGHPVHSVRPAAQRCLRRLGGKSPKTSGPGKLGGRARPMQARRGGGDVSSCPRSNAHRFADGRSQGLR